MNQKSTVRSVTYDLLRTLGLTTTVFGNPGSTEQPFLQEFPTVSPTSCRSRRRPSAIATADAFAQVTGRPHSYGDGSGGKSPRDGGAGGGAGHGDDRFPALPRRVRQLASIFRDH